MLDVVEDESLLHSSTADWRTGPGFLVPGHGGGHVTQVLLGRFLADRVAENPLPEKTLFADDGSFRWGGVAPLEKVIASQADLDFLALRPRILQSSTLIVEPWDHVGRNPGGEPLRASKNVAYLLQRIADCDSVLLPVWKTGLLDLDAVVALSSTSLAVVFEGGAPSVHEEASFSHPACPRADLFALVESLLLARGPRSAPVLFICLGHQLAARALVHLVRRALDEIQTTRSLGRDRRGEVLAWLQEVAARIRALGEGLMVRKADGRGVAGWTGEEFAVTRNEEGELGTRVLRPYRPPPARGAELPRELIVTHQRIAAAEHGVIDTLLRADKEVAVEMFHGDEVNEEAILFVNWALGLLHESVLPHRHVVATSGLSWLLKLPTAVEILASTSTERGMLTECAATCLYYRDPETNVVRRSFTCQFHPELLPGQLEIGRAAIPPPSYTELKRNDGVRLLAQMLYEGLQE
jgi:hypothetical protein